MLAFWGGAVATKGFYLDGQETRGPFSAAYMVAYLASLPDWKSALVWRKGFADWQEAASVPDLFTTQPQPLSPVQANTMPSVDGPGLFQQPEVVLSLNLAAVLLVNAILQ
jgi:hypothetical protein